MTNTPGTDRQNLITRAYANDEALATRYRIHELYSVPKIDFHSWVLDRVVWQGDEWVLDLGSGPGAYFDLVKGRIPRGKLFAADLSLGMAKLARSNGQVDQVTNGDAQALPFASGTFDVVLANHMLYHVPNLHKALSEIHRVLKPNGKLIAATNSQYSMPQLEQLLRRACGLLGARNVDLDPVKQHQFYLEDASMKAAKHFFAVSRFDLPSAFVFPTAGPVIEYVDSMRALREGRLPRGITWEDMLAVLSDQVQRLINHFGELVVDKLTGVIVATDKGDFAEHYVQRLTTP